MNRINEIIVTKENTIKQALAYLDQSDTLILLMTDDNGALIRTITDGDIRRLLLSGLGLNDSLQSLDIKDAIVVNVDASHDEVLALMDKYEVNQIPVIDENRMPIDVHIRKELQPRILLSTPHMGDYELQYVEEAFRTNWIAPLGPNVDAFEKSLADYLGIGHAAALSSGTSAIHLALRLLDVGRDDVVLCSSFTFVASANPILYQGGTPVFIDSEPATWNMSPIALEKALKTYCNSGRKPKAIIVVHLYGQSADMDSIMKLSRQYDVPVIEDAAESLGAKYQGVHTGTYGTFGIFSFNGNKIITTSGGGMLVSNDEEMIKKARFLSTQALDPAPFYEHSELGYNYRMSNVLAGIGRGQLKVLDSRVKARRDVFDRYHEGLAVTDCFEWMPQPENDYSNRWLSVASLNQNKTNLKPTDLIFALSEASVEARHVWKPMHQQPLFDGCDYFSHGEASFCDHLFDTGICLPSASNMTQEQQKYVIHQILNVLREAS